MENIEKIEQPQTVNLVLEPRNINVKVGNLEVLNDGKQNVCRILIDGHELKLPIRKITVVGEIDEIWKANLEMIVC